MRGDVGGRMKGKVGGGVRGKVEGCVGQNEREAAEIRGPVRPGKAYKGVSMWWDGVCPKGMGATEWRFGRGAGMGWGTC